MDAKPQPRAWAQPRPSSTASPTAPAWPSCADWPRARRAWPTWWNSSDWPSPRSPSTWRACATAALSTGAPRGGRCSTPWPAPNCWTCWPRPRSCWPRPAARSRRAPTTEPRATRRWRCAVSDACGCGGEEPRTGEEAEEHEPQTLWQVGEIRFAAVAAALLLAGYSAGWVGAPDLVGLVLKAAALAVAAWTFVPG